MVIIIKVTSIHFFMASVLNYIAINIENHSIYHFYDFQHYTMEWYNGCKFKMD